VGLWRHRFGHCLSTSHGYPGRTGFPIKMHICLALEAQCNPPCSLPSCLHNVSALCMTPPPLPLFVLALMCGMTLHCTYLLLAAVFLPSALQQQPTCSSEEVKIPPLVCESDSSPSRPLLARAYTARQGFYPQAFPQILPRRPLGGELYCHPLYTLF
jgi:hypothetical protein